MTQRSGNFDDFGMYTITLAGPLEAKLRAPGDSGDAEGEKIKVATFQFTSMIWRKAG